MGVFCQFFCGMLVYYYPSPHFGQPRPTYVRTVNVTTIWHISGFQKRTNFYCARPRGLKGHNNNSNNNNNNTLFKHIYAHKHDTRYIFEKLDRELIPIKGPLTELYIKNIRCNCTSANLWTSAASSETAAFLQSGIP